MTDQQPRLKVKVYHSGYGCDTGCCGHIFEIGGKEQDFCFDHPYNEDHKTWARKIIEAHWPECVATIDWDTLDVRLQED